MSVIAAAEIAAQYKKQGNYLYVETTYRPTKPHTVCMWFLFKKLVCIGFYLYVVCWSVYGFLSGRRPDLENFEDLIVVLVDLTVDLVDLIVV